MRKHTNGTEIQMIRVDRITVLNPRVRDKKKFREIVDSIAKVGLKQPIKVSPIEGQQGEPAYNLVYGQGRLEAFIALGQTEIPAIVVRLSEEDSLIMSLVENVARRHRRPIELLQGIAVLKERGYTDAQIAQKTGFSTTYVGDIRHLLEAGEERLLVAVENGQMPLNVAVDIAAADDGHIQDALADAYEKGHLRGKATDQGQAPGRAAPKVWEGPFAGSPGPHPAAHFICCPGPLTAEPGGTATPRHQTGGNYKQPPPLHHPGPARPVG